MTSQRDPDDFGDILAAFEEEQTREPRKEPRPGDRVQGTIAAIGDEVVFVDLGAKSEGIIHRAELLDPEGELTVAVGDSIAGLIGSIDESGTPVIRVRPGQGEMQRSELRLAWEQKLPVEGMVTAIVKGGVEVTVSGLRAFCPVSQLADRFVQDPAEFLEQRLEFRIERFEDSGRHTNIVLSRRALLAEAAEQRAEELRARLQVGANLEGTVTSLTSYGAFVDLGGLEGLLHVSEMSYQRIEDPRQLLTEGQRIDVQVVKIEAPRKPGQSERISLSTRSLQQDPWKDVEQRFPVGTRISGNVMRLETFGAFVELTPGVEGLVHVSRLGSADHVRHAREVLQLGEAVQVEVLSLEIDKRRISLRRLDDAGSRQEKQEYESYLEKKPSSSQGALGSLGDFFKKSRKDE